MHASTEETRFLLELLRQSPQKETAGIYQQLAKAQDEEQCVRWALKRIVQVALFSGCSFYTTAYQLPHLSEAILEPLSYFFFFLSSSLGASAVAFLLIWQYSHKTLTRQKHTVRAALWDELFSKRTKNSPEASAVPVMALGKLEVCRKPEEVECIPFPTPSAEGTTAGASPCLPVRSATA
jgi:hypothetical protein